MISVAEKGYKAFQTYLAIKSHFTHDSYDFFKYNGKVAASANTFRNRKDRYYFAKVENKYSKSLPDFFVANFIARGDMWIGELTSDEAHQAYMEWRKRMESLSYMFKRDMVTLRNQMDLHDYEFDDLFKMKEHDHPVIFKILMNEEISLESFVILDKILDFIRVFDKKMLDDPIWSMYNKKIRKYKDFIRINKTDYRKIVRQVFVD